MKPSILYRIAAILLLLFAVGHTLGFRQTQPQWGVDSLIAAMRSIHFDAQGFNRTYWDFYTGFGLFVSVFMVFAAVLSWQMGGCLQNAPPTTRPRLDSGSVLRSSYDFILALLFYRASRFSVVITLVLAAAAYSSGKYLS